MQCHFPNINYLIHSRHVYFVISKSCLTNFVGRMTKFWDTIFKTWRISDHLAKIPSNQPRDLKDYEPKNISSKHLHLHILIIKVVTTNQTSLYRERAIPCRHPAYLAAAAAVTEYDGARLHAAECHHLCQRCLDCNLLWRATAHTHTHTGSANAHRHSMLSAPSG